MSDIVILGIFVADTAYRADRQPKMGETILGTSFVLGPGGKGSNQSVAAAMAGGNVTFISRLGKDAFADLSKAIESWGNKAADTFADFVVDGKASFGDLINSMLKDIVRLQSKQVLDPITKGANSWLSTALGNLFGRGGGATSVVLHGGGIVGSEQAGFRSLPPMAFAGAPRYHSGGIAGDEVPAILRKGEGVFTPGQMAALGGRGGDPVTINQTVSISVGVAQTVRAEVLNMLPQIQAASRAAVMDARLRGGSTRAAFRG